MVITIVSPILRLENKDLDWGFQKIRYTIGIANTPKLKKNSAPMVIAIVSPILGLEKKDLG